MNIEPIDLRPNGKLCLDNMKRYTPSSDAFVDPLTQIWSINYDLLLTYINYLGLKSLEHSQKIVDALKVFRHWEGQHLQLDDVYISDENIKSKYVDNSLHFHSDVSAQLVKTTVISCYRYFNVGKLTEQPQPSLNVPGQPPHSYINRVKNLMLESKYIDRSLIPYFALDDEASYSISDGLRANEMTDILASFIGPKGVVIDMTACVGGNVLAFSRLFNVRAQEIDSLRYTLLRYNCMIAKIPSNKYLAWCVDSLSLFNKPGIYQSDCVFCDPPWGGPDYVKLVDMELSLGDMDLIDIALKALKETKVFMCRTTFNYNRFKFNLHMDRNEYEVYTYVTYGGKDRSRPLFYLLLVVRKNFRTYDKYIINETRFFRLIQ